MYERLSNELHENKDKGTENEVENDIFSIAPSIAPHNVVYLLQKFEYKALVLRFQLVMYVNT